MTIMAFHWTAVYAIGGMAGLVWRAFFTALLYHVTWFVNSAAHLWGAQEYKTGDQSRERTERSNCCRPPSCGRTRDGCDLMPAALMLACVLCCAGNNWWVGWLAFGEGWHNNHHAFEYRWVQSPRISPYLPISPAFSHVCAF